MPQTIAPVIESVTATFATVVTTVVRTRALAMAAAVTRRAPSRSCGSTTTPRTPARRSRGPRDRCPCRRARRGAPSELLELVEQLVHADFEIARHALDPF